MSNLYTIAVSNTDYYKVSAHSEEQALDLYYAGKASTGGTECGQVEVVGIFEDEGDEVEEVGDRVFSIHLPKGTIHVEAASSEEAYSIAKAIGFATEQSVGFVTSLVLKEDDVVLRREMLMEPAPQPFLVGEVSTHE